MPELRVECGMMQVMMMQHSMPPANMACITEEGIVKQVFAACLTAVLVSLSIHHALSPFPASLLNWLLDHLLLFLVGLNIATVSAIAQQSLPRGSIHAKCCGDGHATRHALSSCLSMVRRRHMPAQRILVARSALQYNRAFQSLTVPCLLQAARILANLLVAGGGVLFRAAAQAYRQAVVSKQHSLCRGC